MKVGLFSPHLFVGGMEKFAVLMAQEFRRRGFEVDLLADDAFPARRLDRAFGSSLRGVRLKRLGPSPACANKLVALTAGYDLFINNSSSHGFPSFAPKSWLWMHYVPERKPAFLKFYEVFANSRYTQGCLRERWGISSRVLYGPVDVARLSPRPKEKIILSSGRLQSLSIAKNELALIRLFRDLHFEGKLPGWSYHIAGALNTPDRSWLKKLRAEADGAPVHFHVNPPSEVLRRLYVKASLFWNGTRHTEHFGAAIVEAMAAGCVPLAFDEGGPREIIQGGRSGWFYRSWEELAEKTARAARNEDSLVAMRPRARAAAARFSVERFRAELSRLLAS